MNDLELQMFTLQAEGNFPAIVAHLKQLSDERDRLREALEEIGKRMDGAGWLARTALQEDRDEPNTK